VTIQWAPIAVASARRYLHDQAGMRAMVAAVDALAEDPYPADGFHRGRYHRLRVGAYRVLYVIDGDLITIERVDRVATAE
jgi:mRNA-degrading endonuclease RelE of RelBE toxin-antitoxin system